MIRFLDGPAEGAVLELRRAPVFLRVVIDRKTGETDALDQLDDQPRPTEAIRVYRRQGEPQGMFVRYSGRRDGCRSAYLISATYAVFAWQPADEVARDNQRWRKWAETAAKALETPPGSSGASHTPTEPSKP